MTVNLRSKTKRKKPLFWRASAQEAVNHPQERNLLRNALPRPKHHAPKALLDARRRMNLPELAVNPPLKRSHAADLLARHQVLPNLQRARDRPAKPRNRRKLKLLKNCAYNSSLRKRRDSNLWKLNRPKRRSKKKSTMRKKVKKPSR